MLYQSLLSTLFIAAAVVQEAKTGITSFSSTNSNEKRSVNPSTLSADLTSSADLPLSLNLSSALASSSYAISRENCFTGGRRLGAINPVDCYTAFYMMLKNPSFLRTRRWDSQSDLPQAYDHQTCSVLFHRASAHAVAYFQLALVAQSAALLVQYCVTPEFEYAGGRAYFGDGNEFLVYVSSNDGGTGVGNASLAVGNTSGALSNMTADDLVTA